MRILSCCSGLVAAVTLACAAPPSVYMLRNARVVRVSSPVLDRADILIRDGVIEAVGPGLKVPSDAWVIEAQGLTIYPGFIDALSTWGLAGSAPPPANARAGGPATPAPASPPATQPPPPPSRGPEDRPLNQSFYRAADHLSTTDANLQAARDRGFTTAVVFARGDIFSGQGAVIETAGDRPGDMVVLTPAGQYVSFRTNGFTNFPGSLMGTIAYIRQIYLDADHYREARAIYSRHPAGLERPRYDPTLDGVLESPRTLLPARRAVEIDRAARLAKELKLQAVLYGGDEAWRATDVLKSSGYPVLVSLKWPERAKDADPAQEDSLRTLEYRQNAPSSAAALAKAGVRFAFYSDGVAPKDIRNAVHRAIEAGLTSDQAVRAFTLSAADIYGVSDRLGSIDPGKIANLVVTDGDWFADKTKVRYTFVDGVKFEPLVEEPITKDTTQPASDGPGEFER